VLEELRSLLARVPALPRLAFQDGTPFADPETRRWIEQEVLLPEAPAAPRAAPEAAPPGADAAALAAAREEARTLAKAGRLGEALGRLEAALAGDPSARGRFLLRLELATLCSDAGHDRVAAPLLEALDAEIARFHLEEWEPGLSRGVLEALYRCRRRLAERRGAPPQEAARAEEIFGRLCRLDPVLAAALE
jgi:type VI secretion system protein VasJ